MALVRWEPVRGTTSIDRLFNTFFDGPVGGSRTTLRRFVPAMDLVETTDHYVLKTDLPGVAEEDVKLEVQDNVLTVSGERRSESKDERDGYVRIERAFGSFRRSLRLPKGVDAEGVTANFDKGVLEIRIPKPQESKPHRVAIEVGAAAAADGQEA
jgi:HSP20 family protein